MTEEQKKARIEKMRIELKMKEIRKAYKASKQISKKPKG